MSNLPAFLDNEFVRETLACLLDRVDRLSLSERRNPLKIRVEKIDTINWLGVGNGESKRMAWSHLVRLEKQGLIMLGGSRVQQFSDAPWTDSATIGLTMKGEVQVRIWLGRPQLQETPFAAWKRAVMERLDIDENIKQALVAQAIVIRGRQPNEIINRLLAAKMQFPIGTRRRMVSAKSFWGNSKVLDSRDELIKILLGDSDAWPVKPLLMHVFLPQEAVNGLLFIENLECFDAICSGETFTEPGWVILYAAGFKGSTQRLVKHRFVRWFSSVHSSLYDSELFDKWVFEARHERMPVRFWGDLDYSGATILRELRKTLPGATSWEPGYKALLRLLERNEGHSPNECGKENQLDPGETGCAFMDEILLPAIRNTGLFVDQEAVDNPVPFVNPLNLV